MNRGNAITVDLPRENPFAGPPARGNRSGGQSTGRPHSGNRPSAGRQAGGRGLTRVQDTDDADSFDDSYGGRQGNVIVLPDVNPFGQDDAPRDARQGGQPGGRPSARGEPRARSGGNGNQGRGVTVLPTDNPFARGGNRTGPRIIEYQPTESEPEEEDDDDDEEEDEDQVEDEEDEDFDYPPPPPQSARRANTTNTEQPSRRAPNQDRVRPNERQRSGNPGSRSRTADPQADDRLVISWVDDVPVSPPRSPSHVHGHHHSSGSSSDSESYFTLRPNPPRSERSVSPGGRVHRSHSHNHRDHHSHRHHGHHHHHDRLCRHCDRLAIPTWQPPFPMPPADWSGYGAPRSPYSPAPPYLYGHPLYANIPHLPSLLDQCRAPYPALPVAPVAFLRDLQAQSSQGAASPLSAIPAPPQLPGPAKLEEWKHVLEFLLTNQTDMFMPKLQSEIFDPAPVDRVFRRLTSTVQVRFGERQGTDIINRVHLVPRGSLAMGTVMAGNPKIDVDLVIPSDFILRRWNVTASETDDLRPRTIADALDLHPASVNRGEVAIPKLQWVFQAIWEQFNGSADGFIFPGGREEAERYLPRDWCNRHKESVSDSNRLRLITVGGVPPLKINVFVKVSLSLYGQDMIVGVDRSSAKSADNYQLVKTLRTPGVPLSESTLSPNLRTAIFLLCWSQSLLKLDIPGVPKIPCIRSSHFHLALTALQQLSPSDKLYIPPSYPESFSLRGVLQTVVKILNFLDRAYQTPIMIPAVGGRFAFPLGSCTIMDALSLQLPSDPLRRTAIRAGIKAALVQFFPIEKALSVLDFGSLLDEIVIEAAEAAAKAGAETAGTAAKDVKDLALAAGLSPGEGSDSTGPSPGPTQNDDAIKGLDASTSATSVADPTLEGAKAGEKPSRAGSNKGTSAPSTPGGKVSEPTGSNSQSANDRPKVGGSIKGGGSIGGNANKGSTKPR
ncbi:unnamed protein product [Rhizoctonia solani]|uniref:Uncharacterized protein n=1 Tax=Rhizoctonia solani TaxID=456999 RepID=A0A8H3B3L4_9AGAM|nr:unnamed protein product [Rhizoctonia solani]